ncbi:hypothetical protein NP493_314g01006 [Ridgeia piscesae]|uniref:Fucosyltransferase n=1 Tax=Ridgeia piscesae TaxID=27915 RepID=A0AAD9L5T6_RIDPI|nr:hypothetical protein NP493_314g01006 [Ridgeia piscesae]
MCVGIAFIEYFVVRNVSIPRFGQMKHGLNDTLKPRLGQMEHESKYLLNASPTQMEYKRHAHLLRLAVMEYERQNTRYVLRQHSAKENERISNENDRGNRVIGITKLTPPWHNWFTMDSSPFKQCSTPIPCEYTSYNHSDIVMIDAFYLKDEREMPPFRLPHQKWLFYHTEAPRRNHFRHMTRYLSSFNITLTYSSKADIMKPYGVCLPNRETIENDPSSVTQYIKKLYGASANTAPWLSRESPYLQYNRAAGKTRLVAWMVSNCASRSKRNAYVNLLQRYIPVDIYGKCGNITCLPRLSKKCKQLLNKTYKFYLAFENSLCSEYITDNVWSRPGEDVVPIVLGSAEYEKYLPVHSYINIRDFSSPRELAKYLDILDKNDTLYNEYFHWKKKYTCHNTPPGLSVECLVCRHANEHINDIEIAPNIAEFWSYDQCMSAKEFYKGIADICDVGGTPGRRLTRCM